jgi:hypothetical protein
VAYQVFETTIFNRKLAAEGRMLFIPQSVAAEVGIGSPGQNQAPSDVLGIRLGVPIPEPEGLVDVLFAALQGRTYSFDPESFDRWRPRWVGQQTEESLFAQELVFGERTPVATSPLRLESMASLASRGEAYVANGAEWAFAHPLQALGIVVFTQGSLLVVGLGRAVRETIVIAAKYHLRHWMGVPEDWLPPEDRD